MAAFFGLFLTLNTCLSACSGEAKEKPALEVLIKVTADPGQPLEGAQLVFAGKPVGTKTDAKGETTLTLTGSEGDTYDVAVKCPTGYQSPVKPLTIPLHRLADPGKPPEYEVSCPPTTRTVVVVVRAENGANLPVVHLGRVVAKTDSSGAATILLKDLEADTQFDLTLDTTEKGNEFLRPQNPSNVFTVKRSDDVFLFDQKFMIEKKATVYHAAPKKSGPIALPTKINQ